MNAEPESGLRIMLPAGSDLFAGQRFDLRIETQIPGHKLVFSMEDGACLPASTTTSERSSPGNVRVWRTVRCLASDQRMEFLRDAISHENVFAWEIALPQGSPMRAGRRHGGPCPSRQRHCCRSHPAAPAQERSNGSPQAIASTMTRPNVSVRLGKTNTSASLYSLARSSWGKHANIFCPRVFAPEVLLNRTDSSNPFRARQIEFEERFDVLLNGQTTDVEKHGVLPFDGGLAVRG